MSTDTPAAENPDAEREPLLQKAFAVAVVTGACTVLAALGVHISPPVQDVVVRLWPVLTIIVPFITALVARKHVTPLADPRAADGTRLVPAAAAVTEPPATTALPAAPDPVQPADPAA